MHYEHKYKIHWFCHQKSISKEYFSSSEFLLSDFHTVWEEVWARNEKPYSSHHVHPPGTDRWPTAADSDFHIPTHHLHVECNWKPGHPHPHIGQIPTFKTAMYFSSKIFLLKSLIHLPAFLDSCTVYHQVIGPLPIRLVCQVFFKDLFGITEFFLWLPCLTVAT